MRKYEQLIYVFILNAGNIIFLILTYERQSS